MKIEKELVYFPNTSSYKQVLGCDDKYNLLIFWILMPIKNVNFSIDTFLVKYMRLDSYIDSVTSNNTHFNIYLFIYLLGANQKEHRLTDGVKEMEIKAMNEGVNVLHIIWQSIVKKLYLFEYFDDVK